MFKYKNFAIIALYFIATSALSEDYQSKSIFKHDYKCVAEEKGGYNHNANGHNLGRFKPDEEFFLVHISNIPEKVILQMLEPTTAEAINQHKELSNQELEFLKRNELEKEYLNQVLLDFMTIEHSSYFIRQPSDDPNDYLTYISCQGCSALKDDKHTSINCYTNYSGKTFQFNVTSGRFTYSYAGTWHEEVLDGYYGDSSSFVFGTCKQYYR